MVALARRRVRTTQPQPGEAVFIDWSNPITQSMTVALVHSDMAYGYSTFIDSGGNQVVQSTVPYVAGAQANTPQGTGGRPTGATSMYTLGSKGSINSPNYSLFAFGSCTSASVTQSALDMDNGTTRYFQFRIGNGKADFIPFNTSGSVTGQATSPVALTAAEMSRGFTMGATASSTRTAVFQNGVVTAATPTNLVTPGTGMPISIGARQTDTQTWSIGALMMVAAWNRTVTDAEMQSLAANPWQIFKPAPRRLLMPLIPIVVNLTPGAASLPLTGVAPTIQQSSNIDLSPGAASFTLSGATPSIQKSANVDLSPGAASIALAGLVPDLQRTDGIYLSPAPATFTLAGAAPSVDQSHDTVLFPGAASFTLTGQAPAIVQETNKDLTPGPASMALAGAAPSVTQARMPADPRYARPIGDVAAGTWLASDGGALSAAVAQDDGITMSTSAPGACEIKLAPVVNPQTSSGQVVRYKAASSNGSGLTVRLKQGAAIIAQWTHDSLPASTTVYTRTLSAAQCDSITDYGDLRFEFEAL